MAVASKPVVPREITDDETRFFHEHGWVKLDSFISTDEAALLLSRVQELMGKDATAPMRPDSSFHVQQHLSIDPVTGECVDRLFYDLSHSDAVGRAGARLRGEPVRYCIDSMIVKMPAANSETGAGPTRWHTDVGSVETSPWDPLRHTVMQFWVALADVPRERGTMRFIAPEHHTERVLEIVEDFETDPEGSYPLLEDLGVLSPPLDLKAGDATVHSPASLHSAPRNTSDEPRWVYSVSVFPASARFTGRRLEDMEGVADMEVGQPFPNHRFPVLG